MQNDAGINQPLLVNCLIPQSTAVFPSTFLTVHDLCKSLSAVLCIILPAAHALTGCDTTSTMFGIGKKSVCKLLKESPDEFKDLCKLGDSDVETVVDASRKRVSNLYDQKGKSFACTYHIMKEVGRHVPYK
jgi:5'-3' exonuclease